MDGQEEPLGFNEGLLSVELMDLILDLQMEENNQLDVLKGHLIGLCLARRMGKKNHLDLMELS